MPKRVENWADAMADRLADTLFALIDGVPEADAPMGAVKLSEAEQLEQFGQIRENPQAWMAFARQNGATLGQMVEYDRTMERKWRKMESNDGGTEPGSAVGGEPVDGPDRGLAAGGAG
jgi:hypothetical protein